MTNVRFLKGNKANLPSVGTDDSTIYFVDDNNELYKSVGNGLPLSKISDVMSEYLNLNDLQSKNPSLEGKLYLTNENKLYTYRNNTYELLSGNIKINADDIVESPSKVLVSPSQRSQIDSNTNELASHTQRLSDLQLDIDNIVSTDDKVAMDASSVATYLSELIDGLTLKNINGKLTVEGLTGLIVSINELNFLQGTTSNIQQQINNLSGVSSFRGVFPTFVDLQNAPNPQAGEYAIVSDGNMSDYYFYYGSNWDYSHATSGVSIIDIANGTSGILPKTRYEKQNASETPFVDVSGKMVATDTNSAILEVFRFADSLLKGLTQTVGSPLSSTDTIDVSLQKFKQWWAGLANVITNKGISTSTNNNGDEIIQKIASIPNISVSGGIKRLDKLNAIAPYNLDIVLKQPLKLEDICATLFEYVPGATGVVKYDVKFNNGDVTDFLPNKFVDFNGVASLQKRYTERLETVSDWNGEGVMKKLVFNRSDFTSVEGFEFN